MPDEKIVLSRAKHWRNYILPGLTLIMAIVIMKMTNMMTATIIDQTYEIIMQGVQRDSSQAEDLMMMMSIIIKSSAIVILLISLNSILDVMYTCYVITDKRVLMTSGFLKVRTSEMALTRCETISLTQKVHERIFSTGDLLIVTAGASIYMDDVTKVVEFRREMMKLITKEQEL